MHMNKQMIIISAIAFLCGILFLSFKAGWLIVRYPSYHHDIAQQKAISPVKRVPITFYFFKDDRWHSEKNELLWHHDPAQDVCYLLNSWLSFLDEEHLMEKKVTIITALISGSGNDLYLSFDRNPLPEEASSYQKWLWVEGLLKTIRENGIKIPNIYFLVHHQPLIDHHIDFNNPWPLQGYLNTQT